MDGAYLTLEFQWALDVTQHDGAGSRARDLDGAVVEDASPQVLLNEDALYLTDDNLVGMAVTLSVAVEEPLVAHKDGRGQVAHEVSQLQVGPLAESGLVDDGLARGNDSADFHKLS